MDSIYDSIPAFPEKVNAGNVIARFVDGLGFRYKWATEGLTENEMTFRPSPSSMDMITLLQHIYDLAYRSHKTFGGKADHRKDWESWEAIRNETLGLLKELSDTLKSMSDEEVERCDIDRGPLRESMPFWNILNGPIADALTHVGQINTWRRTAGNPQWSGVNPFVGKRKP